MGLPLLGWLGRVHWLPLSFLSILILLVALGGWLDARLNWPRARRVNRTPV
jgi:hypothetical protein